jgi:hypothetical protein
MRVSCFLFGCWLDPVDESSPFECFRCGAVPPMLLYDSAGTHWCRGVPLVRRVYRWRNGWPWNATWL